jgi:hypothetical protein
MPLTNKGEKIMHNMKEEYGSKKGKEVFYASRNAGKIKGVDPESSHKKSAAYCAGMQDKLTEAGYDAGRIEAIISTFQ